MAMNPLAFGTPGTQPKPKKRLTPMKSVKGRELSFLGWWATWRGVDGDLFPLEEGFGEPWFPIVRLIQVTSFENASASRIELRGFSFQTPIRA